MKNQAIHLDVSRLLGFRLCQQDSEIRASSAPGSKIGKPKAVTPGAKIGGKVGVTKARA